MGEELRCLTLTQPWATLVAIGAKRIETRPWATSYRGPLAIHAAKGLGPVGSKRGLVEKVCSPPFAEALLKGFGRKLKIEQDLPFGAIVAVCELKDCWPTRIDRGIAYYRLDSGIWWSVPSQERAFGDYSDGRYAWLLADIRRLPEPIPAKGALGLWRPDAATLAAIQQATTNTED